MEAFGLVTALVGVGLLSFCSGLFLLKLKRSWCPTCGANLRCPVCAKSTARGSEAHRHA
jgi:hypothetical protein